MKKRREFLTKMFAGAMSAAMVMSLFPASALAADGTASSYKDGTYTGTATVEPDEYHDFDAYDISVTVEVSGGKITSVDYAEDQEIASTNGKYATRAINGVSASIIDKNSTEEIDAVTTATCSSNAIVEAVSKALEQAEAEPAPELDVTVLEAKIAEAGKLAEADYTSDSWSALQTKLSNAETAAEEKESSEAISGALNDLDSAIKALVLRVTESDKTALSNAIKNAGEKEEDVYESVSWNAMQAKLSAAQSLLETVNKDSSNISQSKVQTATDELNAAVNALKEKDYVYVLVNIPYAEFYKADLNNNDVPVDVFTSATKAKTKTGSLAGGSYHTEDGSEITGVTFPVKMSTEEFEEWSKGKTEVTDDDTLEITVTNRGQTSTTTYTGKEALFEEESYSYYVLSEAPSYYKSLIVENGEYSFGEVVGEVTKVTDKSAYFTTDTTYGDYELDLNEFGVTTEDQIYGVIVSTTDGTDYGMRHLENIWRVTDLAWCTGFTEAVHSCPTDSKHYASMMGKTIDKVTYYTSKGIYEIDVQDIYVPITIDPGVSVADADAASGFTTIEFAEELPEGFDAVYAVKGLNGVTVEEDTLKYSGEAMPGSYALTITDKNGTYAPLSATFTLTTDAMPAAYNKDDDAPALTAAEDAKNEELVNYLGNITSVTVNGTLYRAGSGRGTVTIINQDGTLNTEAKSGDQSIFAEAGTYEITVAAAGYTTPLTFTYEKPMYVLMNIPYAEFYKADLNNNDVDVDVFTSATKSKTKTGSLAGGSYHTEDGSEITGVTFPVKMSTEEFAEWSKGKTEVTDDDTLEITVTNRGQTSTTTYTGKEALFEEESYSYYVLSEVPSYYKSLIVENGKYSFGEVVGKVTKVTDNDAYFTTDTTYGDYELDLNEFGVTTEDQIYGVIVSTTDGTDYGMRHLENIWRVTDLAWCTGFTEAVHGCPTDSKHYESMMGKTIDKVTYYTSKGIYEIDVQNIYVPITIDPGVSVADADAAKGSTTIAFEEELPEGFDAVYAVKGLDDATVEGDTLKYSGEAMPGSYTLTITDKNGTYAPLSATFTLTTEAMPAAYNEDDEAPALTAAEGVKNEELANYLGNITSVTVNGTPYRAGSGRGTVTIINQDGTLNTEAKSGDQSIFGEAGTYEITVTAAGYTTPLTFTYEKYVYVLMNIPYAEFYKADLNNNDVDVDVFTSATKSKTKTGSLAGGSYHTEDGSEITGVTFPVKLSKEAAEKFLSLGYQEVKDDDKLEITVTNRGQTSTTVYEGKDALFEGATYSYYVLSEVPEYYKELTIEDGTLSFGKVVGEVTEVTDNNAYFTTETTYGDYELDLNDFGVSTDDQIYGVIVSTTDGTDYGMRHLENIWRVTDLAWCTGFTDAVHSCPTDSEHYASMMGKTIDKVTYYTSKGIYEIDVQDIYVPITVDPGVSVQDADVKAGSTTIEFAEELPEDFEAEYAVKGLDISVEDGVLTFENAEKGAYTLRISDASGKYADIVVDFILYTEDMPVVYNNNNENPALIIADGFENETLTDYISNISSVSVNGTAYVASGRRPVVIINEDGTINTDADAFAEGEIFEIVVSSTGYKDLTFTYYTFSTDKLESVIETAEGLNESDYTAESWAALKEALANAEAALEAKESSTAVDQAAADLQAAIGALSKKPVDDESSNNGSDGNTNNGSNVNSGTSNTGSNAATGNGTTTKLPGKAINSATKTSDAGNVFSWLGLAIASAAAGGFTWRKKRK